MVDIALDLIPSDEDTSKYRDLLVENGDLVLTADAYQSPPSYSPNPVVQDILQRVRFFAGEWFLDNTQGLPYFQQILVKNPNQYTIDGLFLYTLMNTPGVISVNQYSISINSTTRVLSISFRCTTSTGTISYSGAVPVTGGQS